MEAARSSAKPCCDGLRRRRYRIRSRMAAEVRPMADRVLLTMGRKRKDGNPLGLEPRVYPHHGQFRYRHRDGTSEGLGTDLATANARARVYNDHEKRYGTIGYFLD